jgi:hypothetical protein
MNDRRDFWRCTLARVALKSLETIAQQHGYDIIRLLSSREQAS